MAHVRNGVEISLTLGRRERTFHSDSYEMARDAMKERFKHLNSFCNGGLEKKGGDFRSDAERATRAHLVVAFDIREFDAEPRSLPLSVE